MTETTVTYTDSTPPLPSTADYLRAIGPFTENVGQVDRVQYKMYEDAATWDAWAAWAQQNAYDGSNFENYSQYALAIKGNWATMGEGDKSFMCVEDKRTGPKGAICVEANLSGTPVSTFASVTYRLESTQVQTKLTDFVEAPPLSSVQDWGFSVDLNGVIVQPIVEDPTAPGNWASFQVMNCEVTTISIECINWLPAASDAETEGYPAFREGDSVQFYWFDGRNLADTTDYPEDSYEKFKQGEAVALVFNAGDTTSTGDGTTFAVSGVFTSTALAIAAVLSTLF